MSRTPARSGSVPVRPSPILAAPTDRKPALLLSNTAPMRAGMSACTGVDGTNPYNGDLDELMTFNKALSQQQINALIHSLRGKH